jgi:uncharacterized phage-associated protein
MFTPRKSAQIAAFFTSQEGGPINIMKLVKLMYLADRESMNRYGTPISFDRMVSLDNGPVLSQTLNLINGDVSRAAAVIWDGWISDRANHKVMLQREFKRDDLDELSTADIEVLESIWTSFGHMDQWALSDYTHQHCPEWKFPEGSSLPIAEADLLRALGRSNEEATALAERLKTERELDRVFAHL